MQKTALLVDDSRVARMTLKKLLVEHEFDVTELASGEDAINHLQSAAMLPDIIFMDVMMDGIDGLTATRQIKANQTFSAIPVVICTGNDTEADRDNALATGAMAVLSKPPAAESLANLLVKFEQFRAEQIENEPALEPATPPESEPVAASHYDETQLAQKVMAQIEQSLLTELKQDMRNMAEDISRQVAADTAEQFVGTEVKASLDRLMPELTRQLMAQVTQLTETTAENIAKQAARDTLAKSAENTLRRVASELDLGSMVFQTLSSEGVSWLKHQEQKLQTQLSQQLQQTSQTAINQILENSLEQRISPLVTAQVNKLFAQQERKDQPEDQDFSEPSAAIARLNKLVIGLGLGLIAVAVAVGASFL
ncbi:MAG: response regulator [Gammaproteobacteria bacterium]|nr:response regulator [Gammaproteobacteria bacterium]